jgi:hypothetical protein
MRVWAAGLRFIVKIYWSVSFMVSSQDVFLAETRKTTIILWFFVFCGIL